MLSMLVFIRPKSDHCRSLSLRHWVLIVNFAQVVGFIKVVKWISLKC